MNPKNLLLSLVSSLLLSVGLARIAERVDPVAIATPVRTIASSLTAPECATPCSGACDFPSDLA